MSGIIFGLTWLLNKTYLYLVFSIILQYLVGGWTLDKANAGTKKVNQITLQETLMLSAAERQELAENAMEQLAR